MSGQRHEDGVTKEERAYVLLQGGIGAAIVNAILNGGIGWLITRGLTEFPVWRIPGVAFDLVATAFGVSFGTVLAMAVQVRFDVSRGRIKPFSPPSSVSRLVCRFPEGVFRRSVVLGAASVPLFAFPALLGLAASGLSGLERATFVGVKTILAAMEGGIVTPLIVLGALLDLSRVATPEKAPEVSS